MIAVDDRIYEKYQKKRALLKQASAPSGSPPRELKEEVLDLHCALFYKPQPRLVARPRLVPHPLKG